MKTEFMPIPESFRGLLRHDDCFLVAFPRSGSRWLRLLLTDLACQALGLDARGIYQTELQPSGTLAPGLQVRSFIPCVYMTPQRPWPETFIRPVFRSHNFSQVAALHDSRIVFSFRQPTSVLISYYYYMRERKNDAVDGIGIDEFCRSRVPNWMSHLEDALAFHQRCPRRCLLLAYGRSQAYSASQLKALATFLDMPHTPARIAAALTNLGETVARLNSCSAKHQRGRDIDPHAHLSPAVARDIERKTGPLYRRALRVAHRQLAQQSGGSGIAHFINACTDQLRLLVRSSHTNKETAS